MSRHCTGIRSSNFVREFLQIIIKGLNIRTKVKRPEESGLFTLVQHIDLSWNHIEPSLTLMYQKLVDLGFTYYNGEIRIVEHETEGSDYHVR